MKKMNRTWASAAVVAGLLSACGGGGSDTTPRTSASSVQVMGDSLQDVGTFGYKFTVQGSNSLLYAERLGLAYGLGPGCNFFSFNGTTFVANTTPGCKDYAIGGAVINGASSGFSAADPRVIGVQLATATSAANYAPGDLLLVDGGANDAAALIGAYLAAAKDGGASYVALISTLLTQAQVGTAVAGGQTGLATAGAQYMTALADSFYSTLQASALNKGAQRVVLMNIPTITNTPRLQLVLNSIATASGGGTAGATARAQSEGLFRSWVAAFNTEIAAKTAGDARVLLVDFATALDQQIAAPAQFGLTNVTTPACPITGVGSDGLPTYTFPTCTATALSAAPPSGVSGGANWWQTYGFSDSFHPTPYGHQLVYQLISKSLAQAGWL
jgi:phospholipase/lecithinase/hemolysin